MNVQGIARIVRECQREAFETEARRGFWQGRPTEAYGQSVEEANEKHPGGREDWTTEQVFMNSPG